MGRKQAREGAMKLLFQMESTNDFSEKALEIYLDNFEYDANETKYIIDAIRNIRNNLVEIDDNIIDNLEGWSIHRLAKVDLSVLRLAIYEILYRSDIPIEVSINEAIEIAKRYSAEESFKFINGVLGGFVRTLEK
ncbi:MAG: transcription antitermination factor NusB [Tissierellia bacterium]|nr:transcription antitermination factor NusB [Tissierellia bacterium]